ncbi:type IV secretion system DNA-binding domain-containing protein [Acinetobacter sp. B5B]|uniref:type IV secretion system DNA-binding domain-containing protein n=1 Tax=Acinetobacter baretiae TaxID=2605383 RepID=UPI0018C2E50F|nr:type IV secretion system DNA-binding domain-containing protein [Acinetobacter baretiae]MBF7684036.1 type IV secretion system DNA-binding domain-containing protein [Acinetobacter baretiae]
MTNALNKKPEWRLEEGAIITGITFLATSVALEFLSWHVQVPMTRDIVWTDWPLLSKALLGCTLSTFGIQTQSWLDISYLINVYGYKTMFMWHFYLPFLMSVPISVYLGYLCAKPVDQHHARGAILLSGSDAINYAKRQVKATNKKAQSIDLPTGMLLHPQIRLPSSIETKGIALIGAPSAGKTQIMKQMMLDMLEQQPHAKVVLLDNKGDFTELFNENQSIILAPWDARCMAWDIGQDIRTELDAGLIAQSLIKEVKGDNSVFSDASRVALIGFIVCLQQKYGVNWEWKHLAECLEWSLEHTIDEFQRFYRIGLGIFKEGSKSSDSVYFSLIANLSFLRQLAQAWPKSVGGLSLRKWIRDDSEENPILLLQVSKAFPTISDAYACAVLNILSKQILSPTFTDSSTRRIHFILDEIAQIPYVEQLKNLAALGRSKGACIWLGIQDFDLLVDTYGQHEVNSLIGMMQTKIILSMGVGTGADFASKLIGEREIFTQDFDENGKRIPLTQSQRLVASSEISQLPQPTLKHGIQGWITVTGWNAVLRLTWPITKFPKVREGIELAEWIDHIPVADISDHVVQAAVNTGKKRLIKKSDKRGDES